MALMKIDDYDPDYRDSFDGQDIKHMDVYSSTANEKAGSVNNVLVDESTGRFRYFIVDTGAWIFGKKVLVPVGATRIDYDDKRVYVNLTKDQVEHLPEVNELEKIDYDHEEQVRGVYSPTTPVQPIPPVGTTAPLGTGVATPVPDYNAYDRANYDYEREPNLYNLNEQDHQTLKLYEERLVANKQRRKTGEVAIGKHVETETQQVAIPIEKERVVIERTTPQGAGRPVAPGEAFREGEVAHVSIYEETPDIRKEAVLREEVNVRKVVEQDTVEASETLRREELDVDTGNLPVDERFGQ
jgi:uncharacterized protein (TIGR02271 family)